MYIMYIGATNKPSINNMKGATGPCYQKDLCVVRIMFAPEKRGAFPGSYNPNPSKVGDTAMERPAQAITYVDYIVKLHIRVHRAPSTDHHSFCSSEFLGDLEYHLLPTCIYFMFWEQNGYSQEVVSRLFCHVCLPIIYFRMYV